MQDRIAMICNSYSSTTAHCPDNLNFATQSGDACEGQSNPGGCISDWSRLKKAYLDSQSSADVENFIFDFYPSNTAFCYVLVMFYDVGPPLNTSTFISVL